MALAALVDSFDSIAQLDIEMVGAEPPGVMSSIQDGGVLSLRRLR